MTTLIAKDDRIVVTGAAGLVGQHLALMLREQGYGNVIGIDKHAANLKLLEDMGGCRQVVNADLAEEGDWAELFTGAKVCVQLHAQIGGVDGEAFTRNNLTATRRVLDVCREKGVAFIVHVSSSVVNSQAVDFYTESKKAQEQLVRESGLPACVLRPTLMFGWFDRKHLGWLARFMAKVPVFPIPGSGRYMRQPLYVRDFIRILIRCVETQPAGQTWDITGRDRIDYVDIMRTIRRVRGLRTPILHLPYGLFWLLLSMYALVDRNPPFTTKQLKALVTPDEFPLIPWWDIFGVTPTPFAEALAETLTDPRYAHVAPDF